MLQTHSSATTPKSQSFKQSVRGHLMPVFFILALTTVKLEVDTPSLKVRLNLVPPEVTRTLIQLIQGQ